MNTIYPTTKNLYHLISQLEADKMKNISPCDNNIPVVLLTEIINLKF